MNYKIFIKRQAQKKLQSLSVQDKLRLTEKIIALGNNPNDSELDVKPLKGEPYFRLRVGNWRIIFDKKEEVKIIQIEKIKPRGDVYK
jgi:mRNA interferase RelE/StbE